MWHRRFFQPGARPRRHQFVEGHRLPPIGGDPGGSVRNGIHVMGIGVARLTLGPAPMLVIRRDQARRHRRIKWLPARARGPA